jgi:hypothetical protein
MKSNAWGNIKNGFSWIPPGSRVKRLERPADHHLDDLFTRRRSRLAVSGISPVPKNNETVSHLFDFIDEMRNVYDGMTLISEPADNFEQPFDIGARDAAGWFIEYENPAANGESARNFDELLLGYRKPSRRHLRGNL